ncbi:hypothetical protein [Amnibacterium setariae]|uniref:Uncharacterized protein n=1 Tax=Amnibacterium setariae TaxID=2306585 RepID=A0A3A1U3G5_9MICO|nr:hypothetical protein [Amnibacterium setariae]RIX31081.1 hypothetical protein D1781_06840 [Amnibacterium setariae]
MELAEPSPRPLAKRDAAALIGVIAILTGESMLGRLDPELAARVAARLAREGLIAEPATDRALQLALSDLVERLRYSLGEYATPPLPVRFDDAD